MFIVSGPEKSYPFFGKNGPKVDALGNFGNFVTLPENKALKWPGLEPAPTNDGGTK